MRSRPTAVAVYFRLLTCCRYEVYANGTLSVSDVDSGDDGVYLCVGLSDASSLVPQQTFATRLHIACECFTICLSLSDAAPTPVMDKRIDASRSSFCPFHRVLHLRSCSRCKNSIQFVYVFSFSSLWILTTAYIMKYKPRAYRLYFVFLSEIALLSTVMCCSRSLLY